MEVSRVSLRDFRSYESATLLLGDHITVLHGANGSGKTNLLEALYFGCTGRSCRTSNERELVRFGAGATRVIVETQDRGSKHELAVGFEPGQPKRMTADGAAVERLIDVDFRPLVAVFLPDRLELVKGPAALRRSHLDQVVAALWPARRTTRLSYGHALAQRNALLARLRAGNGARATLAAWDHELAGHALQLMSDRAAVLDRLAPRFSSHCDRLGLAGSCEISYRPRSAADSVEQLTLELAERHDSDIDRGFTGHGPHRDELSITRDGHLLRAYGSQGEQRLALLALLLAERDTIADARSSAPLMLLDDVMSELDSDRRSLLVEDLRDAGQCLITTTDLEHVPYGDITTAQISAGAVHQDQVRA